MDKKELIELDNKFKDNAFKITKKNLHNDKINILDFYPNFDLKGPYTSYNPISAHNLKPFQLLPFFNNLIVDIKPFKNEHDFNNYYGMTVDELLELNNNGVIKFRLPFNYSDYYNLDNDYLDEILGLTPPSSAIINSFYGCLINNQSFEKLEEYSNLFKNNTFDFGNNLICELGAIDPLTISAMDIANGYGNPMGCIPDEHYKNCTHHNFNKLWECGYIEIIDFLKRFLEVGNGRLDWAFVFSTVYSSFLSEPILDSLNGTHLVNHSLKLLAKDLSLRNFDKIFPKLGKDTPQININNSLILSSDVAKVLCESISIPTLLSFEDYLDYDVNDPIKALQSLEEAVTTKKYSEIFSLSENLRIELQNAGDIAKNMRSSFSNTKNLVDNISLTVGAIGSIGSLLGPDEFKPLFGIMDALGVGLGVSTKSKLFNLIFDKFNRMNKENHVLYLYDNYDKFSVEDLNKYNYSNFKITPFRDDLTKKFEYYEYLYENIPILRLLIEITNQQAFGLGYQIESDDTVIKNHIENWMKDEFPLSKLMFLTRQQLLYGESYILTNRSYSSNSKKLKVDIINPKCIRPIYDDNVLKYKINSNNNIKLFSSTQISSFEGRPSIIENYIFFLDLLYPDITKKGSRPLMIHDLIENNGKKIHDNFDNFEKSVEILNDSLSLARKLPNNIYHESGMLLSLGLIHLENKKYKEAIRYFESAQDMLNNVHSDDLIQRDKDLTTLIIGTQKLL